ncbi:MAG: phosphomethylpyrimidine synthase ThiC [Dehalococcoidia bacterium]|nr:phosphomethylpyrimidine synthase ThiC [Dehalococcoidia bacterium]
MTQLTQARAGNITSEMVGVACAEEMEAELLCREVAEGMVVIPANVNHRGLIPCGIGRGLCTKVNANLGTSADFCEVDAELNKLQTALAAGADAVMDLSTGGDLPAIRRAVLAHCPVPLGSVPIYEAAVTAIATHGAVVGMSEDDIFEAIERHGRDGVDFVTVHCGVTRRVLALLKSQGRVAGIVSRGGAFLAAWMLHHEKENPLYEHFDRLLAICLEYDITLSLGDGLRPGSLADATDRAQIEELVTLGELVARARKTGVQVMVEGPGHMPLGEIEANVMLQKKLCGGAPFYVLGPLVTDIGAGRDHITSAIGGAVAAAAGADFLCYVTPSEHLSLPDSADVREGVMAARLAAHAADIAKGVRGAAARDMAMSAARKKLDWEEQQRLSLDPECFAKTRSKHLTESGACSMCGRYCAMKMVENGLGITAERC